MLLLPLLVLAAPLYRNAQAPVDQRVRDLVSRMTPQEKARQLDMYSGTAFVTKKLDDTHMAVDAQVNEISLEQALGKLGAGSIHDVYPNARVSNQIQSWVIAHNRLGIPVMFIEEGVHGYDGFGDTVYPCSINLASTFDEDLARETAAGIGAEARACGVDMILGPVLDVAREPRWGRIEEDFGEDPYLSGALAAAYVKGMQGDSLSSDHNVISEPKHFAGHGSPESGNNTNPVHAGEREFRSIFLRSFEPAIKAGARGVMAAYHEVDGVPCAANPWLLTDVLRGEWGFKGFVLSDLGAIWELSGRHHVAATEGDAVRLAIASGVDMQFYDFKHETFQNALIDPKMPRAALDRAVSRVLRVKFELGLFDHPYVSESADARARRSPEHLATSLRSSRESMILLKNQPVDTGSASGKRGSPLLPLPKDLSSIAIIGSGGLSPRLGDYTPSQGVHAVTLLAGIAGIMPAGSTILTDDGSSIPRAVETAQKANIVILALGEGDGTSGEGADRSDLDLPGNQVELLEQVVRVNRRVVLVLQNGRPLTITKQMDRIPAILECWYPGEFGGQAMAETLFGDNNPSGRLPITFPRSIGQIPSFYNYDVSKQPRYVEGAAEPLFPFGFGLSYTSFGYSNLVSKPVGKDSVEVSVDVKNIGGKEGDDVVQLYLRPDTSSVETPGRALKGFTRVHLKPGETKTISFELGAYELAVWSARKRWEVEPGTYTIWAGGSSAARLTSKFKI